MISNQNTKKDIKIKLLENVFNTEKYQQYKNNKYSFYGNEGKKLMDIFNSKQTEASDKYNESLKIEKELKEKIQEIQKQIKEEKAENDWKDGSEESEVQVSVENP